MSFALRESMHEYIDNRVAAGNCVITSAYIRNLVRRDQQGEVRHGRREGGIRLAVTVAKATNAALDLVELDLCVGSPALGKRLGIPERRTWRAARSRCSGATWNEKTTLMWCGCWTSAKTSPRSESTR